MDVSKDAGGGGSGGGGGGGGSGGGGGGGGEGGEAPRAVYGGDDGGGDDTSRDGGDGAQAAAEEATPELPARTDWRHNTDVAHAPGGVKRAKHTGKRAVVVGNGPSVLHSNMGEVVDGYDHVYRFNLFKTKVRLETDFRLGLRQISD